MSKNRKKKEETGLREIAGIGDDYVPAEGHAFSPVGKFAVDPLPFRERFPSAPVGVRVERLPVRFGEPVPLAPDARYVINVGSVTGCAPDHGPSPAWAVVDEAASTVTYHHASPPTEIK
jgi:hypothetical protein